MKVDAGADVGILAILKRVSYTPAEAIAEFVDNSVQSYLDNKDSLKKINSNYKLKIDIVCEKDTITIKDNAAGIADEILQKALKTAAITNDIESKSKRKNNKNSLNEFGMGMKASAYWFTDTWTLETKSIYEKKEKIVNLDLNKIMKTEDGFVQVNEKSNSMKGGYTVITLKKVNRNIAKHEKIVERLGSIHRKFLSKDVIVTYTAGKDKKFNKFPISWIQPKIRKEPPYIPYQNWINNNKDNLRSASAKKTRPDDILWKIPFDIEFGITTKMKAKGYVAKMDEQLKSISGFYYFRRGKLLEGPVHPETFFNGGKPDGSSTSNAIYAEVDFEGPDSVFTKNEMSIDERDRQDFEMKLRNLLRQDPENCGSDLLKQLRIANIEFKALYDQEKKLIDGSINPEELEDYKLSQKHHGIESAFKALKKQIENPKMIKDPKKPLPKFEGKITPLELTKGIKIGNKKYTFILEQTFEEKASDPWLDYDIDDKKNIITIRVAMAHPFLVQYFLGNSRDKIQQGIKLLAQYFIYAEIMAKDHQGVKRPSVIRENINGILYELPPLEGKKIVS